jgi:hypothetical protein
MDDLTSMRAIQRIVRRENLRPRRYGRGARRRLPSQRTASAVVLLPTTMASESAAFSSRGKSMRHIVLALLCIAGLSACGNRAFRPTEYPLRDGLIPTLTLVGPVTVSNRQPATDPVVISSYGGSGLTSSLNEITEVMVRQTQKEVMKNGHVTGGGVPKTVAIRVDSLRSRYIAFFYKSQLDFEATLGDGQVIRQTVHHSSGVLPQDLDGCIAESVMVLLNDPRVKNYLAR